MRLRHLLAASVLVLTTGGCYLTDGTWIPDPAPSNDVRAVIHELFDPVGQGDKAVGVAHCESTEVPDAVSRGGGNWGLFQINRVHRDDFEAVTGAPWSDVLDARLNATYARHLYDDQGWRPWSCRGAAPISG